MWPDYVESSCRANYSYFWSADYMKTFYHCTAVFTLPLSLFTFYVIWNVTPVKMSNLKWPMLISHCWSVNLDLMFTVYIEPMVFYPSASGLGLGVLGSLGMGPMWQAYLGQVSCIMMGIGMVTLYENRHSQITTIRFKLKTRRARVTFFLINYILALVIVLPFYLEDVDQTEYRQLVLKRIPCPVIEFYDPRTYVLLQGGEAAPFWSITIVTSMVMSQTLFFLIHTMYHIFKVANCVVSQETKTMQKMFLRCISIQVSVPTIAIFIPIFYSMVSDKLDYYNQAYNNTTLLAMSNHGVLATACTLYIYKPYRDFIRYTVLRRKEIVKAKETSVVSRI